ncbi:hypothetical protein C8N35_106138 [Breoghania corrubedonensis]|uniref:Uncharacterized protein n=1 Tax=Breoghania corrubedonensis TaxID=665038 RepID=A0A2T5V7N3_9HYPH|nr:hypothetical protein [Breoghania corrubedonensis]PTW59753.1 hypothetical protein C8N35_106138 [Breoghania corrubedonensis]
MAGGEAAAELDARCAVLRHVLAYLAAVFVVAVALSVVIHTMLTFERFGPPPPFSALGLRQFLELASAIAGLGWIGVAPVTWVLLARGWRGWPAFALAGLGYAVALAGIALFSAGRGMAVRDALYLLAVLSGGLSVILVPANFVYWALAIHSATLGLWPRICRKRR